MHPRLLRATVPMLFAAVSFIGCNAALNENSAKSLLEARFAMQFNKATYGNFRFISNGNIMASLPPQTQMVNIGTISIVKVYDLSLAGSAIEAVAKFEWQAKLNPVGAKAYGNPGFGGNGTAHFAKKPDGSWTATDFKLTTD